MSRQLKQRKKQKKLWYVTSSRNFKYVNVTLVISDAPHDGQAVPQSAEALVDIVGLFLPGARRARPRPPTALAAREVNHPEVGVLAL